MSGYLYGNPFMPTLKRSPLDEMAVATMARPKPVPPSASPPKKPRPTQKTKAELNAEIKELKHQLELSVNSNRYLGKQLAALRGERDQANNTLANAVRSAEVAHKDRAVAKLELEKARAENNKIAAELETLKASPTVAISPNLARVEYRLPKFVRVSRNGFTSPYECSNPEKIEIRF